MSVSYTHLDVYKRQAIGTGSNANRLYTFRVIEIIRDLTGIGLAKSEYPIDLTQNNDVFVEVSGLLKSLAVNIMKISTDLRIMNSKPFKDVYKRQIIYLLKRCI